MVQHTIQVGSVESGYRFRFFLLLLYNNNNLIEIGTKEREKYKDTCRIKLGQTAGLLFFSLLVVRHSYSLLDQFSRGTGSSFFLSFSLYVAPSIQFLEGNKWLVKFLLLTSMFFSLAGSFPFVVPCLLC